MDIKSKSEFKRISCLKDARITQLEKQVATDEKVIFKQKDEISQLKMTINKLRQKK